MINDYLLNYYITEVADMNMFASHKDKHNDIEGQKQF